MKITKVTFGTGIGGTSRTGDAVETSVRLLPQYNACVLGSSPRGLPILLIDGEVSGIGERKTTKL